MTSTAAAALRVSERPAFNRQGMRWGCLTTLVVGITSLNVRAAETVQTNAPAKAGASELATPTSQAHKVGKASEAIVQERLTPSTPDKLIERHGFVGALFSRPKRVNPLQLINPTAPKEFGGTGTPGDKWSWNPMLGPGQAPLPRTFQDPNSHEASAVVFGGSFR
jgi:hypothetical protein